MKTSAMYVYRKNLLPLNEIRKATKNRLLSNGPLSCIRMMVSWRFRFNEREYVGMYDISDKLHFYSCIAVGNYPFENLNLCGCKLVLFCLAERQKDKGKPPTRKNVITVICIYNIIYAYFVRSWL